MELGPPCILASPLCQLTIGLLNGSFILLESCSLHSGCRCRVSIREHSALTLPAPRPHCTAHCS